jgi:regulator of protease activity HflC (stomatin/prohibitin superfamily)
LAGENAARAQGVRDRAQATGEAWSFIALLSQYRSAPQDYTFRRRLEVLEQYLSGRRFTVIDSRFQRDGGELWLMP